MAFHAEAPENNVRESIEDSIETILAQLGEDREAESSEIQGMMIITADAGE
jgi:hypothetical protein